MKSILITYDTMSWNDGEWEQGEAAAKLDLIDDVVADTLMKSVDMKKSQMDSVLYYKWESLEKIIDKIEELRRRAYIWGSIKSIKEVGVSNA